MLFARLAKQSCEATLNPNCIILVCVTPHTEVLIFNMLNDGFNMQENTEL